MVALASQLPLLLLTPLGGMLADRFSRRSILLVTHTLEMSLAAMLAWLAWKGQVDGTILIFSAAVLGTTTAFEMPSRQSMVAELVHDKRMLGNAIALNALAFNVARLLGPALAGITLALTSEPMCFALNVFSYMVGIATLLSIHPSRTQPRRSAGTWSEAFAYVRGFAPARWLIATVGVSSFCTAPFMIFMPVYAKDVFHGGPDMLGTLVGTAGCGALISAVYLARHNKIAELGKRILLGCFITALAGLLFGYNVLLTLALPLVLASGMAFILTVVACNMLLQSLVAEHLRGRVMSLYSISVMGLTPFASLIFGFIAKHWGTPLVFLVAGLVALAYALLLRRNFPAIMRHVHPVLHEKGLA
jgi:MFS family permease